jgi:aminoglycoside/choline kinase family phosphotransferase
MSGERDTAIAGFLRDHGWGAAQRTALAGDASFRRYHRLVDGDRRAILMDAPPPMENVRPFMAIDRLLRDIGLSAPEIRAADTQAGLLLLEDFGDDTYTRLLADGGSEEAALYGLAVDVLIALQQAYATPAEPPPPYDDTRLGDEAALLVDWYLPAVSGQATDPALRRDYLDLWTNLFPVARGVPDSLVLRDFHIDNLMLLPGRDGVAACGLLDFQDAVVGPRSYDLVSLLEDARRDVPADLQRAMLDRFLAAFPDLDRDAFAASYAVLGAQRSAKIVGIFTRLWKRDGKPQYLAHIPRLWRWLDGDLAHPALAPMRAWFDQHVPPALRVVPRIEAT